MNDATLRYKLYEAAIETGISSNQYHELMTEGVLDWVKNALSSVSAGKEMAGDIKKMFNDKKNQVIYKKATEEIQKSVAELFKAGAASGVEKDQLKDWLIAGINKMTEDAAAAAPEAEKSEKSEKSEKPASGQPLDAGKPEVAVPMIAAAAAQAAGQDVEKAQEQATEKKIDVPKATQVLSKAISASSKVKLEKVTKIIDFLIQNKHMLAESRYSKSANLISAAKEASLKSNQSLVVERWITLAGIKLLKEEEAPKVDDKKKKQFSDVLEDIRANFKPEEMSDDEILNVLIALDDLDSISIK